MKQDSQTQLVPLINAKINKYAKITKFKVSILFKKANIHVCCLDKRLNSDAKTKSKSKVRFKDYSNEKENFTDIKSVGTAASSKLTTSDKNTKKRPPICKKQFLILCFL